MEQRITLFRFHTPACIHGYSKPIYEHERSEKVDCRCPIYGRGYLRNEQKRIDNKTLAEKGKPPITDWDVAFAIRKRWLKQGNTSAASSNHLSFGRHDSSRVRAGGTISGCSEKTRTSNAR